jgi:amidohydrolase
MTAIQTTTQELKDRVLAVIDEWRPRLVAASHDLHAHPEVAFEEYRSSALVADLLRDAGFDVEQDVWGLPTAIEAVYGSGELTVVICAEYDALPGIGHACGHNIIATSSVGAAIALSRVADEIGVRVKLLGTPAEEVGGGKALMLEAGAWEDATVSMMVHPGPGVNLPTMGGSQSRDRFRVEFTGRASHAAAAPSHGINAGDAATIAQVAFGLLRQQLPDGVRLSAVTLSGGDVSNIIPATAIVEAEVRSFKAGETAVLKERALACFAGAALATGCSYTVTPVDPVYESMVQYRYLADRYDENLLARGREFTALPPGTALGGGSTDMGNVSLVVPSIHPMIGVIGTMAMPHTADFATATASAGADEAIVDAAFGMAATIVDLATDAAARAEVLSLQASREPGDTRRPALAVAAASV